MTDAAAANEDPAIVGVPPETPEQIRPSATGLVVGPVDTETDVVLAGDHDVDASTGADDSAEASTARDQLLEDAEGGIEGSLLDAPDGEDVGPI